jgi:GNAT superfamily N-acetyltransferase
MFLLVKCMHRQQVVVKAAKHSDIESLERDLPYGSEDKHRERLQRQDKDEVLYLVAWHKALPVGHALLKWQGAEEKHIATHFNGSCPDVEDLYVVEHLRSKGIGSQILEVAESFVRRRGYNRIGLSVGVENTRAKALYQQLGYRDSGLGEYSEKGEYVDSQGQLQNWEERCIYLVKSL